MKRARLSRDNWITAGFDACSTGGPNALAAEPLARALGTTKGSFYWHFKDVPAFQDAILATWQEQALGEIIVLLEEEGDADKRLRSFGHIVLASKLEPQLRIWAQNDSRAARVLAEVDAERLAYLARLLGLLGLRNPDFARALQAALTGIPLLSAKPDTAPFEALVDTVLALA
ncbi:Transcriptional regulatory protein [Sulfitobacter noctilucicola]|uniref:AcrR family transcriptional regulator n=1 Tax=Sulfitobacter noctilucicola TaxID=1342301 RepID=A0A7W6Q341_9RHOB|nr:TetR/AcrR family transcriptional regulator [Sulfitobacter noctilucicola]KIN62297.1 Transcriptional regulatory protein [Sulfitobacter noctilucicola]MBB4173168.1 AcrR family transcriptional regulator [Sulfitobacter noctilucicola]